MIIVIVAIDQITKYFAKTYLLGNGAKPFIKGVVEFVYAQNTGVAFSLFDGGRWLFWSLGVIVSGAIGNLIDRIFLGYVIDFINPTFVNFAVFNIADCAVTLGTISLMAYLLFDIFKKENKDEPAN